MQTVLLLFFLVWTINPASTDLMAQVTARPSALVVALAP